MAKKCKDCGCEVDIMNIASCVKCNEIICEDCAVANKFKCKECNPNQKQEFNLEYIRRSHIEDYKDCPYHFYLEVIKGIEVPANIYAQVGIDLHDMYESYQRNELGEEELRSKTVIAVESLRGQFDDELVEKMVEKAKKATEGFLGLIPSLTNKIVALEETIFFEVKDGLPKVRITMDRIDEDENGDLHLHDWKTGKVMVGKHLMQNLQVPLYIHACQEHYKKPVKSFTLYYVSEREKGGAIKSRRYNHVYGDEYVCTVRKKSYTIKLSDTIKEVQAIFARIKAGRFSIPDRPNYFKCNNCHFKEIGQCANSDIQPWINANQNKGWGEL